MPVTQIFNRPKSLTILGYGSYIISGLSVIFALFAWLMPVAMGNTFEFVGQLNISLAFLPINANIFYPVVLVFNLWITGAVYQMMKGHETGFLLFATASILMIGFCLIFTRWAGAFPLVPAAFYALYALSYFLLRKHLS